MGENQVLMRPQTEMHFAGNLMLHFVTGEGMQIKLQNWERTAENRLEG